MQTGTCSTRHLWVLPHCSAGRLLASLPRRGHTGTARRSPLPTPPRPTPHNRPLRRLPAATSAAPGGGSGDGACPVRQFIAAFNARDLDRMLALMSEDCCFQNLSLTQQQPHQGKEAVRAILTQLLASTPADWQLVVEQATGRGVPGSAVGLTWQMAAKGRAVPLMAGLSFYKIDSAGKICYLREASEQFVKLPTSLAPLLRGAAGVLEALAGPAALPDSSSAAAGGAAAPVAAEPRPGGSGSVVLRSSSGGQPPSGGGVGGPTSPSALAAAAGGGTAAPVAASNLAQLQGVWLRDDAATDMAAYERALALMGIGGLQRTTAMQLLEGLELQVAGGEVAVRFLTVVPFFSVTESFSLSRPTSMPRRDLKPGSQRATAAAGASGELVVNMTWEAPDQGSIREEFSVDTQGRLVVDATVSVGGRSQATRQVYRRANKWQPRFKWPGGGLWGSP